MEIKKELKILAGIVVVFLGVFFMPLESPTFNTAMDATLDLSRWYAREHVILCLLPAFLIAGVISVFVSQASVIKYFGAKARGGLPIRSQHSPDHPGRMFLHHSSPVFQHPQKRGRLGPAIAFLYSGPAINILAIIQTAKFWALKWVWPARSELCSSASSPAHHGILYRKEEKAKPNSNELP
jgi:uncharacterized membrane protein YraQ (UPF0718 family)